MEIFIIIVGLSVVITILVQAFFINLSLELFKVKQVNYANTLLFFILWSLFLVPIYLLLMKSDLGIFIITILQLVFNIIVFYLLLRFIYKIKFLKCLGTYVFYSFISIVFSIISVVLIHTFVVVPYTLKSNSMMPTFDYDDCLIVQKYNRNYKYDDIVLYELEDGARLFARVIAEPGERVAIKDGKVFFNGKDLKEDYTLGEVDVVLGDDEYFVLHDDRESLGRDSRRIGPIAKKDIIGSYLFKCQIDGLEKFK